MRVSELASLLAVNADTIRYYTRIGLLQPDRNVNNGYKIYSNRDKARLEFILSARSLGFSVADVRRILDVSDQGDTPCPLVRELMQKRLMKLDEQFREIMILRSRMEKAVAQWRERPDRKPDKGSICHLIEGFSAEDATPSKGSI